MCLARSHKFDPATDKVQKYYYKVFSESTYSECLFSPIYRRTQHFKGILYKSRPPGFHAFCRLGHARKFLAFSGEAVYKVKLGRLLRVGECGREKPAVTARDMIILSKVNKR